jgi:hypothetical protein
LLPDRTRFLSRVFGLAGGGAALVSCGSDLAKAGDPERLGGEALASRQTDDGDVGIGF